MNGHKDKIFKYRYAFTDTDEDYRIRDGWTNCCDLLSLLDKLGVYPYDDTSIIALADFLDRVEK